MECDRYFLNIEIVFKPNYRSELNTASNFGIRVLNKFRYLDNTKLLFIGSSEGLKLFCHYHLYMNRPSEIINIKTYNCF